MTKKGSGFAALVEEDDVQGAGRGCLAGLISWKLGGGVVSTIIIFIIAYVVLGQMHC